MDMRHLSSLITAATCASTALAQAPTLRTAPPSRGQGAREYISVDAPVVVLDSVRIIDGTGAPPIENRAILIQNGKIAAIAAAGALNIPAGARVLELPGHTVMPGLVGMHDHTYYSSGGRETQLPYSAPRLYLGTGVTTIRTIGSIDPYTELNIRKAIDAGALPGPRMFISGPYLNGGGTHVGRYHLKGPEDADHVIGYWAGEDVKWFKAYTSITRAELGAAIEAAHKRGLKITGHLCSVTFHEAAELGIDNLEHGLLVATDFNAAKKPDECPAGARNSLVGHSATSPEVQALIRELVSRNVAITSTLAVWETFVPNRPPLEPRVVEAMLPQVHDEVVAQRTRIASDGAASPMNELFTTELAFEREFVKAGGNLVIGIDPTGYGGALPGFGDQRNLELLVEAGFTPMEAVKIATSNGAALLGESARFGTVQPGKLADLMVIRGNPATNMADVRNLVTVFKDGVGYDSAKLLQAVKGSVGLR